MIKWFDADKFLPGKCCGTILARHIVNEIINQPYYEIAHYTGGAWFSMNGALLEGNASRVTHWAHINEPFE